MLALKRNPQNSPAETRAKAWKTNLPEGLNCDNRKMLRGCSV
jgi:hypothetical protein